MVTAGLCHMFAFIIFHSQFERDIVKQHISSKERKKLENKIANFFEYDMKSVPVGFRKILADDLASALESRIYALNQAQTNLQCIPVTEGDVEIEKI
jgi:hypothetical protein